VVEAESVSERPHGRDDSFFPPAAAAGAREEARAMGKDVTLKVPRDRHAFMGPHNALGTLNEALAAQILAPKSRRS